MTYLAKSKKEAEHQFSDYDKQSYKSLLEELNKIKGDRLKVFTEGTLISNDRNYVYYVIKAWTKKLPVWTIQNKAAKSKKEDVGYAKCLMIDIDDLGMVHSEVVEINSRGCQESSFYSRIGRVFAKTYYQFDDSIEQFIDKLIEQQKAEETEHKKSMELTEKQQQEYDRLMSQPANITKRTLADIYSKIEDLEREIEILKDRLSKQNI